MKNGILFFTKFEGVEGVKVQSRCVRKRGGGREYGKKGKISFSYRITYHIINDHIIICFHKETKFLHTNY